MNSRSLTTVYGASMDLTASFVDRDLNVVFLGNRILDGSDSVRRIHVKRAQRIVEPSKRGVIDPMLVVIRILVDPVAHGIHHPVTHSQELVDVIAIDSVDPE